MEPTHEVSRAEARLSRRRLLEAGAAATLGVLAAGPLSGRAAAATEGAAPQRGGTLRVGMPGGGARESLNPNELFNEIDIARMHQLYERLAAYDQRGAVVNQLAQEFSADKSARVWKIKVRPGVEWHDGSPLTADDVAYSLRYIATKRNNATGYSDISFLTPRNVRRLDRSTVEIRLAQPNALLPTSLAARSLWIFKNGTTNFDRPIGTGPFMLESFTAGQQSVFVRNPNYRRHGGPYLDTLEIISFTDDTARTNALRGGVIDALPSLDLKLAESIVRDGTIKLLRAQRAGATVLTMAVDSRPFNDRRVRQAFRLVVDRAQMVQNVLAGNGVIGNDLFWPNDPDYARLPQRQHDPERAKSLLKAAGQENLRVSLYTSDAEVGMLDSATLMAQQARDAGITVTLDRVPGDQFYNVKYLKAPFACSAWTARPLTTQFAQCLNSTAPFNETHWKRPDFDRLTNQARTTLDRGRRRELWVEAQKLLWNEGGYIVWGFRDFIDAHAAKVQGLRPSVARPLGAFNFVDVHLA